MVRAAKVMRQSGCRLIGLSFRNAGEPRNRMREIFTSGSVGRAPGNRCFYPEWDPLQRWEGITPKHFASGNKQQ